jgi:uncharacterized membrane protein YjjB (DUF3815 family)
MTKKITLKASRVNAGFTIAEASLAIGVYINTLARWEKDPSMVRGIFQEQLSKLYGMPINQIDWKSPVETDGE